MVITLFAMLTVIVANPVQEAAAATATSKPARRPPPRDWPMFRGDSHLSGVAGTVLPEKLVKRWSFKPSEEPIESSAAIVGGVVYIGCDDGFLYALDLATGKPRWKFKTPFMVRSSPTIHDGAVYFGDEDGIFYCVDAKTGKQRWSYQTGGEIISSANIVDGRIIFGSYDAKLYCLSLEGKLLWEFLTEGRVHATPAVVDGRALVAGCDAILRSIDIKTGKEIGNVELGSYTGASPAVFGQACYMGTFGEQVVAVDWHAGQQLWYYEHADRKFPYLASAAVTDKAVFVAGRDKIIRRLDRASGKQLWEHRTRGRIESSPVVSGKRVYVGGGGGKVLGLNIESGKVEWEYDSGAPFIASPAIGEGCLVIGNEDGVIFCFAGKDK